MIALFLSDIKTLYPDWVWIIFVANRALLKNYIWLFSPTNTKAPFL